MQSTVGANVGVDENIKDKSLIVRIFRKWNFTSGTTSKEKRPDRCDSDLAFFFYTHIFPQTSSWLSVFQLRLLNRNQTEFFWRLVARELLGMG